VIHAPIRRAWSEKCQWAGDWRIVNQSVRVSQHSPSPGLDQDAAGIWSSIWVAERCCRGWNVITNPEADARPTTFTSIRARGRRLQNWRPARDFGLYQPIERSRVALFFGRDRGSEIGQTFRNDGIVESFVQRCGKLADDLLRHSLRVCPETSVRITKFSEHEPD
jgi:hypothetical protein